MGGQEPPRRPRARYWCQPLPIQQFQALLTLFSKFFSSFPHGTCSLSVSRSYLALDGIYHPLRTALASNSTRRKRAVRGERRGDGVETLCDRPFQGSYPCAVPAGATPLDYNSTDGSRQADFQVELLPVHSPLLGESLLVSFPPLSYMLKFSGSSCLISGQRYEVGWGRRVELLPRLGRALPLREHPRPDVVPAGPTPTAPVLCQLGGMFLMRTGRVYHTMLNRGRSGGAG